MWDTHEICECCGVQFGLDVMDSSDVVPYRQRWLASGAKWFFEESQPEGWNHSAALERLDKCFD